MGPHLGSFLCCEGSKNSMGRFVRLTTTVMSSGAHVNTCCIVGSSNIFHRLGSAMLPCVSFSLHAKPVAGMATFAAKRISIMPSPQAFRVAVSWFGAIPRQFLLLLLLSKENIAVCHDHKMPV